MARAWRSYPRDRVDHDELRALAKDYIVDKLDEAADYLEHLEDELQDKDDRIEELEDRARDLRAEIEKLEREAEAVTR